MTAECSWDSSIHENQALNRVTPGHEHVYAVLKVAIRLSHPADMEIILRKRLCFNIYKKASIAERLMKRIVGTVRFLCETSTFDGVISGYYRRNWRSLRSRLTHSQGHI